MTAWVLDCSVALAWSLPDERSAQADRFRRDLAVEDLLWIPALWWYELTNALTAARRRQRLTEADVVQLIDLYRRLPLSTDGAPPASTVSRIHALAWEYGLSAYDAAYLELAQRHGCGLATLDRDLASAARSSGITVA